MMDIEQALAFADFAVDKYDGSPRQQGVESVVVLAAEVRRLRAREAEARELATITVDTLDDLRADALRDEWSRWLGTE